MKIRFWGGVGTVTGSKHLVTSERQSLLLECGLYQGRRDEAEHTNRHLPFKARDVDHCIISHAHIDHVGNVPNLVKNGYRGPVLMTKGTAALTRLLLLDSAKIQEADVSYLNKKRRARGEKPKAPIYTTADAEEALRQLQGERYARQIKLGRYRVVLHDAGHILGSAQVDVEAEGRRLLFTGDLGRRGMAILQDPVQVTEVDCLVIEATYGDREHSDYSRVEEKLAAVVNRVVGRGGRLIVPAFAVERSQEIIYALNRLLRAERIPRVPVYVDSPLASQVTEVFRRYTQYYDTDANHHLQRSGELFDFPGLHYTESADESKALNVCREPCIIISAAGMCEAGRVLHHLKHAVGDERNLVLIVSYQAPNTLGRRIAGGERRLRIFGDWYDRRCEVEVMDEFSAHADRRELLEYVSRMNLSRLKKVFLVHAEREAAAAMVEPLRALGVREVLAPEVGDEFEL